MTRVGVQRHNKIIKEFFISLPIAKSMHDAAVSYRKNIHNFLGKREGSIFHVHRSVGFNILI
jgi:hypothetical protein